MIIGIGIPKSQSKMGMTRFSVRSLPGPRSETSIVPRTIAMLTSFGRGKAGGERAKKQRCRHPKRELRPVASQPIRVSLCLLHDLVDAFFRVRLIQARVCYHQACNISSIGSGKSFIGLNACRPQSRDLSSRCRVWSGGCAGRR
jgi:hypothetical protein